MNKIMVSVQDLRQACGSIPKPLSATDKQNELDYGSSHLGVYDDLFDDHEWVSEISLAFQETGLGGFELRHRGPLRGAVEMLWFSAPTSLKNDSLNGSLILEKIL